MRFSIIMPVYNAGKYLSAAIDSILSQSFTDFELIIIDDGSSDGSADICDKYARQDQRIVVVHRANSGISKSRNEGLKIACGEYVGFCDHDDEYLPGFLEKIDSTIKKLAPKIVDWVKVNHESYKRWPDGRSVHTFSGYHCSEGQWDSQHFSDPQLRNFISTIWDSFFRREFVASNDLKFNEDFKRGGEDILLNLQALSKSDFVWHCGAQPYYRHFLNVGTSTTSTSHSELLDAFSKCIQYEVSHFPTIAINIAPRYNFWRSYYNTYIFFARGNSVPFFRAAQIQAWLAKQLLPADKVMSSNLPFPIKLLAKCRLYFMLGAMLMLKGALFRTR